MTPLYGTIEYLSDRRSALVSLTDASGRWFGAERVTLPRAKRGKQELYEIGYSTASRKAAVHGGRLETFKEVRGAEA